MFNELIIYSQPKFNKTKSLLKKDTINLLVLGLKNDVQAPDQTFNTYQLSTI